MNSKSEGKLPEADRKSIASTLDYVESFDQTLFVWLMAVRDGEGTLDLAAEIQKCRAAIEVLERSSIDIDNVLKKVPG
jgi:hypothetical protein